VCVYESAVHRCVYEGGEIKLEFNNRSLILHTAGQQEGGRDEI